MSVSIIVVDKLKRTFVVLSSIFIKGYPFLVFSFFFIGKFCLELLYLSVYSLDVFMKVFGWMVYQKFCFSVREVVSVGDCGGFYVFFVSIV